MTLVVRSRGFGASANGGHAACKCARAAVVVAIVGGAIAALSGQTAAAQTCNWAAATTGDWSTVGDWSCGFVPNFSNSTATTIDGASTVAVTSAQSANALNDAGILNLSAELRLINSLALGGTINVAAGGILDLDTQNTAGTDLPVSGGGSIVLNAPSSLLAIEGNGKTITLGPGISVQGQGTIGTAIHGSGNIALVNNGTIAANAAGGTLNLNPPAGGGSSSVTNNNLLTATGGGILALNTAINNSSGGIINADAGSVVTQNGFAVSGGTITTSGSGVYRPISSNTNFLSAATLSGTMDLATTSGRSRVINGLTLTSAAVNVGAGGVFTIDTQNTTGGNESIAGTGSINLQSPAALLSIEGNGNVATLAAGITVQGQGTIGTPLYSAGNITLVNNGTISANAAGGTLSLNPPAGGGSSNITNNNLLSATGGGTLALNTLINNGSGQITADSASLITQNGVAINGGTVATTPSGSTGVLRAASSSNNFLSGVTVNGGLDLTTNSGRERIVGGLTLNGAVNVGNSGVLTLDTSTTGGDVALTTGSTGSINLNDSTALLSVEGNGHNVTVGAGVTIQGQGTVGTAIYTSGNVTLVNNGTVDANVSGGALTLNPPAGGGASSWINNGVLEAENGGILNLNVNITANPGTQLKALTGGAIRQNGVTLNGVLNVASGTLTANSSSSNFFNGVSYTGNLDLTSTSGRERVINGLTLNGSTFTVGNSGVLTIDTQNTAGGSESIAGTGTIVLADSSALLSIEGNGNVVTLASGLTLRGQGTVGSPVYSAGNITLVNNGTISANAAGGTLSLNPPAGGGSSNITNNNLLSATGGGTLAINTLINNGSGQISADLASLITQNGVLINGGTVTTTPSGSTGVLRAANNNSNFLSAVTLNGGLDLTTNSGRERILGGLTLNGAVNVGNSGVLALDTNVTGGDVALTTGSTASINLNDSTALLAVEGNGHTATIGAGVTIQGQGRVGTAIFSGGNVTLVNNGTISANAAGAVLNINPPANGGASLLANNSLLTATGGGILALNSTIGNSGSGVINADTGSVVTQNAVVVSGGTITTSGSGAFRPANSSSNFLSGVTLAGTLDLESTVGRERVINGLTLSGGTVNVGPNSVLSFDTQNTTGGNETIGGTGTINMHAASALFSVEGNGNTATLGAGVTVQGQGTVGQGIFNGGNVALVNNGTVNANTSGGTLSIVPPANGGASSVTNNGTFSAGSGGTLNVTATLTNFGGNTLTGGTYRVDGTAGASAMKLTVGNNLGGEIVNNAANIVLNGTNANTGFVDANGNALLSAFAANQAGGSLTIDGGYFLAGPGDIANAGNVTIGAASTLQAGGGSGNYLQSAGLTQGAGFIAGNVAINGGGITPGSGALPGTLGVTGSYSQASGAVFNAILSAALNSLLNVSGNVALATGSSLNIVFASGFAPVAGETFDIMNYALHGLTGEFSNAPTTGFVMDGWNWTIDYAASGGSEVVLQAVSAVPLPAGAWLMASGLLSLAGLRRWRGRGTPAC